MTVTVGFTRSDRTANYFPMSDGFREGAAQDKAQLVIPLELLVGLDAAAIAEAVFVATNHPEPSTVQGLAGFIARNCFNLPRSLSVGDTVEFGDTRMVCDRFGWTAR